MQIRPQVKQTLVLGFLALYCVCNINTWFSSQFTFVRETVYWYESTLSSKNTKESKHASMTSISHCDIVQSTRNVGSHTQ